VSRQAAKRATDLRGHQARAHLFNTWIDVDGFGVFVAHVATRRQNLAVERHHQRRELVLARHGLLQQPRALQLRCDVVELLAVLDQHHALAMSPVPVLREKDEEVKTGCENLENSREDHLVELELAVLPRLVVVHPDLAQ
jgi:hypothetical protein